MIADLQGEIWVPIFRRYAISNMGRVKSFVGIKPRILRPADNGSGYFYVVICIGGKKINWLIHRLVALIFVKNINPLRVTVNHHKGTFDNRYSSLSWMTQKENSIHGVENGLLKSGSKHHNSVLDETQVQTIKSLANEIKVKHLALYFNVSLGNIYGIINGKRWRHMK